MLMTFNIRTFVHEAAKVASGLPCRHVLVAQNWSGDVTALAERWMR
jgi:hypothetical protein